MPLPRRVDPRIWLAASCIPCLWGCTFERGDETGRAPVVTVGPSGGADAGAVSIRLDATASGDRNLMTSGPSPSGDGCGTTSFMASNLPPDLLIVLDRSGSMNEDATGTPCLLGCGATSKWAQMTSAINSVVGKTDQKVRWGLKFFGSSISVGSTGIAGGCNVDGNAEVPIAPSNASAIASAIAATTPSTSTPTRAALTQAAAYLTTVTDANPKYILLATDGQPNCGSAGGGGDDAAAIAAVTTVASMGYPTFVIGIATGGSAADGTLNMMAMNGGHPRAASPQYYPVSTSQDLEAALADIQGKVALPCQFQLGGVPSKLSGLGVSVAGQPVSASDWTYGPGNASIVFPDSGSLCASLKSGAAKDVRITLPCGEVIVQ